MICTADGGSDVRGMWHVWGTREVHVWFWWGNLRERDSLEDLPVDGTSIIMDVNGKGQERVNWINLVQDRDHCRAGDGALRIVTYPLKPSGHCMYRQFDIQQFYVLPTDCICVFCVDLRTNSDYFPIQH